MIWTWSLVEGIFGQANSVFHWPSSSLTNVTARSNVHGRIDTQVDLRTLVQPTESIDSCKRSWHTSTCINIHIHVQKPQELVTPFLTTFATPFLFSNIDSPFHGQFRRSGIPGFLMFLQIHPPKRLIYCSNSQWAASSWLYEVRLDSVAIKNTRRRFVLVFRSLLCFFTTIYHSSIFLTGNESFLLFLLRATYV